MARYLLDTNVLIDFSKGYEPVAGRLQEMLDSTHELGICGVQIAEFFTGLPPEQRSRWEQFFETLSYWEISVTAATRAGIDRHDYARQGRQLSTDDCLTAVVAREQQAILVTNNGKDFPMPDIDVLPLHD